MKTTTTPESHSLRAASQVLRAALERLDDAKHNENRAFIHHEASTKMRLAAQTQVDEAESSIKALKY